MDKVELSIPLVEGGGLIGVYWLHDKVLTFAYLCQGGQQR